MFGFQDPRVQLADCRINAERRAALIKKTNNDNDKNVCLLVQKIQNQTRISLISVARVFQ